MSFKSALLPALTALTLTATTALTSAGAQDMGNPIQTARLSAQLFAEGAANDDALLMITAAKLRKGLTLEQADASIAATELPESGMETDPLGWESMLDTAAELAMGDPVLEALIDDVRTSSTKGVATGQVYSISQIGQGGSDKYNPLTFTGGDYADVYVEGRSGADLNLFIYDSQGRLVCSDTDISAIAYCGWRPASTEGFTIVVENKGSGGSGYALMTN